MVQIYPWLKWIGALAPGLFFLVFSGLLFFPERAGPLIYGPHPTVTHSIDDAVRLFLLCGGFTLLALGFGAWVLLAAYTERKSGFMQKFLQSRWLAPIGIYSYGIYVFHVPILGAAQLYVFPAFTRGVRTPREFVFTECAYIVVLTAVTFIVAALSYELFEKRILRLKRYFEPKYAPASHEARTGEAAVAQEESAR